MIMFPSIESFEKLLTVLNSINKKLEELCTVQREQSINILNKSEIYNSLINKHNNEKINTIIKNNLINNCVKGEDKPEHIIQLNDPKIASMFDNNNALNPLNNLINISLKKTDSKMKESAKEFYDLIEEIVKTFEEKNSDYAGVDNDFMSNFKNCEKWGIECLDGLITRFSDKVSRSQNMMRTKKQFVKDESLIDTFKDMSVYALFIVITLRRIKNGGKSNG